MLRLKTFHEKCNTNGLSNVECRALGIVKVEVSGFSFVERSAYVTCSSFSGDVYEAEHADMITFLNKYSKLTAQQRMELGHQAENFIRYCSYNGFACNARNFTVSQTIQYGNCYTFNSGLYSDNQVLTAQFKGQNSGLELILDLEPEEYTKFSSDIGARVVVHDYKSNPSPENDGINISPGFVTYVAMEKNSIFRLPYPYKDRCMNYQGRGESASQESCFRHCIHVLSLEKCGCIDPTAPEDTDAKHCNLSNRHDVCCLDEVLNAVSEGDSVCDGCRLPCKSVDFKMVISNSFWPSAEYYYNTMHSDIKKKLAKRQVEAQVNGNYATTERTPHSSSVDENGSDELRKESIVEKRSVVTMEEMRVEEARNRLAKVKIFFSTLDHKYYRQEPMFQNSELFSQLGGQMGLWLGLSLVALFEMAESLMMLVHRAFQRAKLFTKKKQPDVPSVHKKLDLKLFPAE